MGPAREGVDVNVHGQGDEAGNDPGQQDEAGRGPFALAYCILNRPKRKQKRCNIFAYSEKIKMNPFWKVNFYMTHPVGLLIGIGMLVGRSATNFSICRPISIC